MGINSEVMVEGRVFHVQTEDMGLKHESIVTHVFVEGRVIDKKRSPYPAPLGDVPFERQLVGIMRAQHDATLAALRSGVLTDPEQDCPLAAAARQLAEHAEALPHATDDLPATAMISGLAALPLEVPTGRPRPRCALLEILTGPDAGRVFPLDTAPLRVGRAPECHIQLTDPTVAPVHAILIIDHLGEWRITRVDAQANLRVDGAARQSGALGQAPSVLEIGRVHLRYLPAQVGPPAREHTPLPRPVPSTDDLILPPPPAPHDMALLAGGTAMLRGKGRAVAPFLLQRAPVTNRQYLDYLEESGAPLPSHWLGARPPSLMDDHPVVGITLAEARAYAEWRGLRIPTAGEWALACRGAEGRRFPWGERWEPSRAACREAHALSTVPVNTLADGRTPEGCVHMVGNVWEWTELDDLSQGLEPGRTLVLGGAFSTDCAQGVEIPATNVGIGKAYDYLGFRCASDLEF